jgi:hypothetical protein
VIDSAAARLALNRLNRGINKMTAPLRYVDHLSPHPSSTTAQATRHAITTGTKKLRPHTEEIKHLDTAAAHCPLQHGMLSTVIKGDQT